MGSVSEKELFFCLALTKVEGVGVIYARKIYNNFPDLSLLFQPHYIEKTSCLGVPDFLFKRIKEFKNFEIVDKELNFIKENNINVTLFCDEHFPEELKHGYDAPFMIFSKGSIDFTTQKFISIVGTRNMTSYGMGFVKELIQDLKSYHPTIVSGYAYGIDICAHIAAIENNLPTVAVLGHGLNQTYPKTHIKYNESMMENGGFVSEFSSSDNFNKENFIKRNRIVAGISKATIVIESALKGGSLSTVKFANDYNKEVFALPGRTSDSYSSGCNHLIKTNQANLITSAQDLIYMLNWDVKSKTEKTEKPFEIPKDLSEEEFLIVDYLLKTGPQILDVIAVENNIPTYKLSVLLLQLELRNIINPLPGKLFEIKK